MLRFKKVYIEITNRCNLQCSFCVGCKTPARDMTLQEFETVAKKLRPYTDYIYLHVLGEPLLHPGLDKILDIAGACGLQVNLTTNGLLLENWGDLLLRKDSLRQINLSLHCRGGYTALNEQLGYVGSMAAFGARAAGNFGKIISFRLWNLGSHDPDEEHYNGLVTGLLKESFPHDPSVSSEKTDRRGIRLSEKIFLNFENRFEWPVKDQRIVQEKGFCLGLRNQIGILSDGTVVPCCLDSRGNILLGNIFTDSMEAILHSDRALKIIEGFNKRQALEPFCQRCTYKNRFGLKA